MVFASLTDHPQLPPAGHHHGRKKVSHRKPWYRSENLDKKTGREQGEVPYIEQILQGISSSLGLPLSIGKSTSVSYI